MGSDAMILVFWMLSFKPVFFTLLFHFHQEAPQLFLAFCHKGGVILKWFFLEHINSYFELWYWRRLLRVLWTAQRSNQSILKEINPEYSLEGLMVKLKLQYFGHLMWRANSLEKTLMLGKIDGGENDRGWDGWMASLTQWTWVWVSSGRWWWTGRPGVLQSMGSKRLDTTERLNKQQQQMVTFRIILWSTKMLEFIFKFTIYKIWVRREVGLKKHYYEQR